jgi:hypothetical protein
MVGDVRTDDGLRSALVRLPSSGGWDGPLGRLVLAEVARRAAREARRVRTVADAADPEYARHLVGVAWECLETQTESVIGARSPWAYVHQVMARAAAVEASARDRMCSPDAARRDSGTAAPHTARRIDEATVLEAMTPLGGDPTGDAATTAAEQELFPARWDPALVDMVEQLVAEGADRATTIEAVEVLLDVLQTTTSRSRVHTTAYRSGELRSLLSRHQVRVLTDLLLGSRREGPRGSAWLLLRQARAEGRRLRLAEAPRPFRDRVVEFAATSCQPLAATA